MFCLNTVPCDVKRMHTKYQGRFRIYLSSAGLFFAAGGSQVQLDGTTAPCRTSHGINWNKMHRSLAVDPLNTFQHGKKLTVYRGKSAGHFFDFRPKSSVTAPMVYLIG